MLKTAMIFGDNMVLQRQKPIKIWGRGNAGKRITVTLKGKETVISNTTVGADGNWMIIFSSMEVERGLELEISDGIDTLVFHDINIGEVWLAGGQSNMEYWLEFDEDKNEVLNGPMNQDIRFFDYPDVSYEGQLDEHDYSSFGTWRKCTREDLPYFSAVGYYFAKELQENLDVPIGIVGCNWSGTSASAWMDTEYLKDNEGSAWLEAYEEAVKGLDLETYKEEFRRNPANNHSVPLKDMDNMARKFWYPGFSLEEQREMLRKDTEQEGTVTMPVMGPYSEKRPGGLYETMLKKVAPYTIRGVIWYQGESDAVRPELYSIVFGKMIECWRNLWEDKLPFIFVQLAPFGEWLGSTGENYPVVRRQQELVSKTIPGTWMVSSSDAGMEWDIHPKRKKPIGMRLALCARGHVYGQDILCDPPEFSTAERFTGGVRINFKNGDGLYVKGDKVNALIITDGEGKELTPDQVTIEADGLLILGNLPENLTISFASTPYYEVNIYNKAHNPAKPFVVTL
ncbi:sialate O-acetylesterase [Clostridium thermarum]|uniref:sialate O-acetylesterase n=1 Tax=Clostridium thermarum TaxID=1716543 RepID=UPI0013D62678|nr:sialate O-acetylesterase [Clostridium thermarum]